ncbi:hypothetical protein FN846DRAFT_908095 [Sphaerosporella brunnea]|uniref:Uncharacterized protein n=1 Tax=Sphaerosporella brunnea TaxID=1250544 RepID=A0A5J5EUD5_9PEZI|nr:hypothetical protein FN846DRAFT_908095 [Sphaerosporella brunnea]
MERIGFADKKALLTGVKERNQPCSAEEKVQTKSAFVQETARFDKEIAASAGEAVGYERVIKLKKAAVAEDERKSRTDLVSPQRKSRRQSFIHQAERAEEHQFRQQARLFLREAAEKQLRPKGKSGRKLLSPKGERLRELSLPTRKPSPPKRETGTDLASSTTKLIPLSRKAVSTKDEADLGVENGCFAKVGEQETATFAEKKEKKKAAFADYRASFTADKAGNERQTEPKKMVREMVNNDLAGRISEALGPPSKTLLEKAEMSAPDTSGTDNPDTDNTLSTGDAGQIGNRLCSVMGSHDICSDRRVNRHDIQSNGYQAVWCNGKEYAATENEDQDGDIKKDCSNPRRTPAFLTPQGMEPFEYEDPL